jgi:hypothetical protein
MDDLVNELLQELKALRQDISAARTEASAAHLETVKQLAVLSESITNINSRVGTMEPQHHGRAVPAPVTGVADLARTAIMG